MTDTDLLRQFVQKGDQRAFNDLARRYLDLVYAAARRYVHGDAHAAEDVTQQVFIDLARKAPSLLAHQCVAGWLYACTRFVAINTIRRDQRRIGREKEAGLMPAEPTENPDWEKIRPVLDEALEELEERDRQFVILRFFGQQSFGAIAQRFAVTENAAQKAVSRALDLLSASLSRRGVISTSAALTLALAQTGVAAPRTLLASVTTAVAAATPAAAATATGATLLAAAKFAGALVVVAAVAGTVGYWTGLQGQTAASTNGAPAPDRRAALEIKRLEQRVRSEADRAASAEADTATLLQAIAAAKDERLKAMAEQRIAAANLAVMQQGGAPYAMRAGDTFAKIAQAYGVRIEDLKAVNPYVNPARMQVGQTIVLPAGAVLREPGRR